MTTLGAGGMGVVYKAIDTRLNRPVAIKAIPEGGDFDTSAVLRLRAEAQSAASLDHPYICKIYELLDTDSETLIVMEFVDGETLSSRIRREGALPLADVLRFGAEVAEGLAAAHAIGLVHRDVKPSNLMITPHGHVKLLDFGIAHASDSGETTTTQSMHTPPGAVAGSPFYMAPEQALGRTLDGKTDIFSLSVVLFECLTGVLPFEGTTRDAYVLDMLTGRPRSLSTMSPSVPAPVAQLVASCLERDPAQRPTAATLAAYLRAEAPTGRTTDKFVLPRQRSWKRVVLTSLAFIALAVPAAWGVYRWLVPAQPPTLGRQEALITWPSEDFDPRVSPDGKWVSFLSNRDGSPRLFITSSRAAEPKPLTDATHIPLSHVWSPDGTEIAALIRTAESTFVHVISAPVGGALRKSIDLRERPVFPAAGVRLLRWVGSNLYISTATPELWRLNLDTGVRDQLSESWSLPAQLQAFDVSPDGRRVVFAASSADQPDLWIVNIDGTGVTRLTNDRHNERQPTWSRGGATVVFQSTRSGQLDLWEIDVRSGQHWQLTSGQTEEVFGEGTASGNLQAFQLVSEHSNIWLSQPGSPETQVTFDALSDFAPTLATGGVISFQRSSPSLPLGHRLLDARVLSGQLEGNAARADFQLIDDGFAPKLSPDGTQVAYFQRPPSRERPQLVLRVRDLPTGLSFTVEQPAALVNTIAVPLGWAAPGVSWNPLTQELYFVGWDDGGYSIHGIAPDAFRRKSGVATPRQDSHRVLAKSQPREQLTDLYVSPDGSRLRYLHFDARSVTPDRKVELREIDLQTGGDRVVRTDPWPQGRSVFHKGWTRQGQSSVLVDEVRRSGVVTITEVSSQNAERRIQSLEGAVPATARVDAARQVLYMTRVTGGVQNIIRTSLVTGETRQVTSNKLQGISFSDFEVRADGALVYVSDNRSSDIWIVRHDAERR